LSCFDGNLLPFLLLLRGCFIAKTDNCAIREKRRDFAGPNLDCFLDNQVHVLPFWNGLGQGDATAQRGRSRFVQFAQLNSIALQRHNLGCNFVAASVEDGNSITLLQTQHVTSVMRFGSDERESIAIPVFRRDIETLHAKLSASAATASLTEKTSSAADLTEKLFRAVEEASVQRRIPFVAQR